MKPCQSCRWWLDVVPVHNLNQLLCWECKHAPSAVIYAIHGCKNHEPADDHDSTGQAGALE